ncbi:MAG: hypothetical protein CVV42_14025 [Candidatus Riflebacteria bacterium HGW-Riflebacteria-2]|jgi:hypothetical protein|nr:MAG: hypothetical protein CVV42_14025 [Candidatus Riflebacteria bacterium HGW-Riflebacteria-2]
MFSICPRCDNGKLDRTGKCTQCGYTLRNKCNECGHYNIPSARFCGGCGKAMTLRLTIQQAINQHLSFLQKIRIRKFAAGAAFGGMLALFAFGSMGMRADEDLLPPVSLIEEQCSQASAEFCQPFSLSFEADLKELRRTIDPHRKAGLADLTRVVDLLIRHLRPVAINAGAQRLPAESAGSYSKALHNFSTSKSMTRGSTAVILFHFLSDLLDFQYRDFSQEGRYSDIPRFHFLTVPANALSSLGVKIARDEEVFGINDNLTVGQLFEYARDVMVVAETSFEVKNEDRNLSMK